MEKHSLPFTEYDFYDLYQKTFEGTVLGRMKKVLPLREMTDTFSLVSKRQVSKRGAKPYFSPEGKVALVFLKGYRQLNAPQLMEQLNGNIHYRVICSIQTSKRMLVEGLGGFRMELVNVPEDIKAMSDAVSRTQVRAKVIPSQTIEVSFKGTPQQMLNALNPDRVMPIHRHRNSS